MIFNGAPSLATTEPIDTESLRPKSAEPEMSSDALVDGPGTRVTPEKPASVK